MHVIYCIQNTLDTANTVLTVTKTITQPITSSISYYFKCKQHTIPPPIHTFSIHCFTKLQIFTNSVTFSTFSEPETLHINTAYHVKQVITYDIIR